MTKLRCEKRCLSKQDKRDIQKMLDKLLKKIGLAQSYAAECHGIIEALGEDVNGLMELRSSLKFVDVNMTALFQHMFAQRERPAFK